MGGRGRGRASGGVWIVVAAPAARFDAPPGVTVTGAPPGPGLVYGVIAGSPISVVNVGYPDARQPARTLRGRPIPYADPAEYADPKPAHAPAVIIRVEHIRGPVFLLRGLDDALRPSCPYTHAIVDRLGSHPYVEVQEPGATVLLRVRGRHYKRLRTAHRPH
jgi:hypothetical protein